MSRSFLLFCSLLSFLLFEVQVISVSGSTAFTAGGPGASWQFGGSYPDITTAKIGDTITFSFTSVHNVNQFPSKSAFDNCDFSSATLLSSNGPYTATITSLPSYFGCSVGGGTHCMSGGMKQAVIAPVAANGNNSSTSTSTSTSTGGGTSTSSPPASTTNGYGNFATAASSFCWALMLGIIAAGVFMQVLV